MSRALPNAAFIGLERLAESGAASHAALNADPALKSRVDEALAWLVDDGFDRARTASADATPDRIAARALDGMLAITFTEAAAADMDAKIRAALARVEAGGMPVGMEEHEFRADPHERARRAQLLRTALERPLAHTIHAWCQSLLMQHPLEAGLHPGFTIDAKGRVLARDILPNSIPNSVRAALADCLIEGGVDGPAIDIWWGEPSLSLPEKVFAWNTFEVLAFLAGNPENPVNAVR